MLPPARPPAPTGLTATSGPGAITLAWNPVATATSYRVKRSTVSGKQYVQVASVTTPGWSDTAVESFRTYYYVVTAVNAQGESPKSAQVSAFAWSIPPADVDFAYAEGRACTLARADATGATRVGSALMAIGTNINDATTIAWSTNGKIFYESTSGLVRVAADGSGTTLLYPYTSWKTGVAVTRAAPAPDGLHHVFFTAQTAVGSSLFTRSVDGPASEVPIDLRDGSPFLQYSVHYVAVSPDGQWVVVSGGALMALRLGVSAGRLVITEEIPLTGFEGLPLLDDMTWKCSFEDINPTWNPNGTLIVFEASAVLVPESALYRIDLANPTSVQVLVPSSTRQPSNPRISSDGLFLYYDVADAQGIRRLYRADRNGGNAVEWGAGATTGREAPVTKPVPGL